MEKIMTFKKFDVLSSLTKSAPDFCSVYVIAKGKVISVRSAQRPLANTAAPPKLTTSYGLPHQLSTDHASLDGGARFGSQLGEDQLGSRSMDMTAQNLDFSIPGSGKIPGSSVSK
ncbi:hypothetical protein Droror1_Dr00018162 [Drosera rotundifolia]